MSELTVETAKKIVSEVRKILAESVPSTVNEYSYGFYFVEDADGQVFDVEVIHEPIGIESVTVHRGAETLARYTNN